MENNEQTQFINLLNALMSGDNDIRGQAETTYDQFPYETKFQYLWSCLCEKRNNEEIRTMAAILLRKVIERNFEEFFPKLSPEIQSDIKLQMLALVQNEENASIRKKICDIIASLARQHMDDDGNNMWPDFLGFLFQTGSAEDPVRKEIALTLFSLYPGVFGNQQQQNLEVIKSMLSVALRNSAQTNNQSLAVKATAAFVLLHSEDQSIQKSLSDLLPDMLNIIVRSIENGEDEELLQNMVDLADSCPKFLRPQVDAIYQLVIKILGDDKVDDGMKHLIIEVFVTMAETAPAMVRKTSAKYLGTLIPQLLNMMTDLEDEEDWSVSESQEEEESDSNATVAESSLDRLACSLGGKAVLPYINTTIYQMLQNENWKYRHAALMAISAIGEGCHKQMEALLPQIMDAVVRFLQDPHPRVRYASCNAIGQMATDFANSFQKQFHSIVIQGLLLVMDDTANPRVQAHAGAALVNFSELCPKEILSKYLPTIMAKLESVLGAKFNELMERGTKMVLEQVVTTIASVADAAEEHFIDYYDRFMPCLMYIIENASSKELSILRGKTIECASLIGLAVGGDKFMGDACKIMDLMLNAQNSEQFADDDQSMSYLISAWARVCKIMGKKFERYLPLVMGPVMKSASMKPEVAVLDNDDLTSVEEDDTWQFVSLGDNQNFGIRTNGLMEKATACQMLVCYARELKESFAEYTEQTVKLMIPHLKFYLHEDVRTAAAESLPCLLECAKVKGQQYLMEMWQYICPELLKAIDTEPENDIIVELMYSLAQCIEILGSGCLSEEQLKEVITLLDSSLKDHFVKFEKRLEQRKDEDYDEVVEEEIMDGDKEDKYILSKIADVVHALFQAYGHQFFPYFDVLLPHFSKLLDPSQKWSDRQYGLCIFDDVIEFGGPNCSKYSNTFLRHMVEGIKDRHPEIRQAAAYGCGVMGQFAGPEFAPVCAEVLPSLVEVIQAPDSRSDTNINPTENAIAAVTKILKYNSSNINVNEMLPVWLSWLPVWEDIDEAPHVFGYLCDLVDANNPIILGQDNCNLPKIMSIFAEAFYKEAVEKEDEITGRMLNITRQLQGNPSLFQACISQLDQDRQIAMQKFLS